MKLSICIPTYNRANYLEVCLNSILENVKNTDFEFELCISNNCSTDRTEEIIKNIETKIPVKYNKNFKNLGMARNILKVVSMATSEFVWVLGDDDLLTKDSISNAIKLIKANPNIDFFYVNSYHLDKIYLDKFVKPFHIKYLPVTMEKFSSYTKDGQLDFFELIDPKVSFDFLGGIFLSIFRRENWMKNIYVLNERALEDNNTYSHFDNTFPHLKIYSYAFSNSKAFFYSNPLTVNLSGIREWFPLYPLVKSVRLYEALKIYRKNGLPLYKYLYCRNSNLSTFANDLFNMLKNKERSGLNYINLPILILSNLFYPNFYLSFVYAFIKLVKKVKDRLVEK